MKKFRFNVLSAVVALLFLGADAMSVTVTSSQSGNWSATSTWGGNPIPVAGDLVIVNGGFTVTVDVPNAVCTSVQLGGTLTNSGNGALSFNSGSHLTVSGLVTVGVGNRNGSIGMASGGTLSCEGFILNSLGTWTPGIGTVEFTASNTLPNNGITSFNDLTVTAGTTTLNANLTVTGNLTINAAGALDCSLRTLTVGGNWLNDGTFTGNTGRVIFNRNGNQSVTGSGLNNFNLITLNMGTSNSNVLEVSSAHFSAADPFLTLSGGTLKMSGTFTFSNSFILGPVYNIQPTDGVWINNPNVTVTAQAGGVSLRGLLRITAGTFNIGTAVNNNLDYVAGASFIIEGGEVNIAGHFGRNNATSSIAYNQSGGTVTVAMQGSTDLVFGAFDIGAPASSFTMSGGTIIVRNATSAPADYLNSASATTVTGGTLQVGDAGTLNAQTIRIQSSAPVGSLLVSGATSQATKPTAQLVSSLNVVGGITVQPATTLNANGLNILLGGDWTDDGNFTAGPGVTFNGSGSQAITRTGGETFNSLTVNKPIGTLTLGSPVTVNANLALTQGTLDIGSNTLTLNSNVSGGGVLTSAAGGLVNYNQGSDGQNVLAGNYGNLIFSNFNKTLAPTGTIAIAGTFTPGSAASHSVAGSTIEFTGGSQSVPVFTYHNLTLSGSGTKTGSGTLTVSGNLTNNPGIVLTGPSTLELAGTSHVNNGTISVATLSVGTGAAMTNNGTATVTSALTGPGALTQGGSGVLNIGGTSDIATINASATGNLVNYTGAAQTVKPAAYHHLTLSGSGIAVLAGISTINGNLTVSGSVTASAATGMSIGGNLTIGSGASFSAGSFAHTLAGNWSVSGTFNAGTSSVTFNGSTTQAISGSTFFTLAINNPSGVSMSGDETVLGTLSLSGGSFSIGAHTLTLNGDLTIGAGSLIGGSSSSIVIEGSGASMSFPAVTLGTFTLNRSNGASLSGNITVDGALTIVSGTLTTGANNVTLGPNATLAEVQGQPIVGTVTTTRNITSTSGTVSFGNIGADVSLNGVALGNTTVLRKTGTVSTGGGHTSIKRYFEITPATNTGLNAGFTFHYDTTEVNFQDPGIFELYRSRNGGGTWNNVGGNVNVALHTIAVTGINDFSRWTAADTLNRIGTTASPTTTGISPASRSVGDSAFVLTVNGTEFVSGKSTVRFNGSDRFTTYVNANQLTASIPASDLQTIGTFPVTIFSAGGGGVSNPQTFTVNVGAAAVVRVETAADGSGTVVPAQSLVAGSSITVYAITRDVFNNFVANVPASTWALQNITGGVVTGDIVPALDSRSAVLTGHLVGSANISASSGSLVTTSSGTVTVTAASPVMVRVETAADGSGSIVPAESLRVGSSITVYAITRDSLNNFVANARGTVWSLQNITGGVSNADLAPAGDSTSAVFTAHIPGSANIAAATGTLTRISSGTITVLPQTGVKDLNAPLAYELKQNYPNPFNPSTQIKFDLPSASTVSLIIYDVLGRQVAELASGYREAGYHSATWNASNQASGVYFAKFNVTDATGNVKYTKINKLVLMK